MYFPLLADEALLSLWSGLIFRGQFDWWVLLCEVRSECLVLKLRRLQLRVQFSLPVLESLFSLISDASVLEPSRFKGTCTVCLSGLGATSSNILRIANVYIIGLSYPDIYVTKRKISDERGEIFTFKIFSDFVPSVTKQHNMTSSAWQNKQTNKYNENFRHIRTCS